MIEATRIKSLVSAGDRVNIDLGEIDYSAFVKEIEDDGILIEWREVEIQKLNGVSQEAMVTKECFIDRELIQTVTKIK
jgi:hypothetical protein